MPELLEFEEPLGVLQKEIEALSLLPVTTEREAEIDSLKRRMESIRAELYRQLTPWQRVLVARHPERPSVLEYVRMLFTDFTEIHGDRRFGDDHAIVTGMARYKGQPVLVVGHHKGGGDTKQKIFRNFGYARPEGYRKALRAMQLAQKFHRPIIVFVDTPAAYPGIESEERGIAEAIALNLREMAVLDVPIVVNVCGEGGSGGALGLAVGDRDPHARVRRLLGDPAGRLRGHPVARQRQEGGGRRRAEAHRAGPAGPRHHRRDRPGAGRRRPDQPVRRRDHARLGPRADACRADRRSG